MPRGERRLAAIMITDVVGFTTLGQRDESAALEILDEHRQFLRPIFAKHRGREVKTMGDAFIVEFGSALEATLCAIDVQSSIHSLNLERGEKVLVRIGIHVGDVVHHDGDVLGDTVNVASRIEPLAEPGGICLSEQVYDHVKNKISYQLLKLEARQLKNVIELLDVYRVVLPWEAQTVFPQAQIAQPSNRIAVLPFMSMSPDPDDAYFADGMTEELISTISKIRELAVISRTSVMQYKNKAKHVGEIARELNVGALLEGSVRTVGNRVRVAVQLIDTNTDKHLWSDNYDRTLEDVFSIQSDIAQSVASALRVTLLESERKRLTKAPTNNPEAHALYLKGRAVEAKFTEENYKEAARFYQRAIAKDPEYALAYSRFSQVTSLMGFFDMTPPIESSRKGEELAKSALALDSSLPEAHSALGFAFMVRWDFSGAEAEFNLALELDPNSATTLNTMAALMNWKRRLEESARLAKRALELDPLSPSTLQIAATWLLYSDHPDEAIAIYTKVLRIDPESAHARGNIGVAYVRKGMLEEGLASIREAILMEKGFKPGRASDLAYGLGKAGRLDELRGLLTEALDWHEKNHRGATAIASIYANLGEKDRAFEWLEKAFEEHSGMLPSVFHDFAYENLQSDPRAEAMIDRLGL